MAINNVLSNFLSARALNESDYLFADFTTTGNIATFPINNIIPFNNTIAGNIPIDNGIITLTANKKYKIEANLAVTSSSGDGYGTGSSGTGMLNPNNTGDLFIIPRVIPITYNL